MENPDSSVRIEFDGATVPTGRLRRAQPGSYWDPCLVPYVTAPNAVAAEPFLQNLWQELILPALEARLDWVFRGPQSAETLSEEKREVYDAAVNKIAKVLDLCRSNPNHPPIDNFPAYINRLINNNTADHLREKYRSRHALKDRFKTLLRLRPEVAEWKLRVKHKDVCHCGFAVWVGSAFIASPRYWELESNPGGTIRAQLPSVDFDLKAIEKPAGLLTLIKGLFIYLGHPAYLERMVTIVGKASGTEDLTEVANSEDSDLADWASGPDDVSAAVIDLTEAAFWVAIFWQEIQRMPLAQRRALLLGPRNVYRGTGCAHLPEYFVLGLTATFSEMAVTLGMTESALESLWRDLPLEDRQIAELFEFDSAARVTHERVNARARLEVRGRHEREARELPIISRASS